MDSSEILPLVDEFDIWGPNHRAARDSEYNDEDSAVSVLPDLASSMGSLGLGYERRNTPGRLAGYAVE